MKTMMVMPTVINIVAEMIESDLVPSALFHQVIEFIDHNHDDDDDDYRQW